MDKGIKLQKKLAMGLSGAPAEAGGATNTSKSIKNLAKGGKAKSCACGGKVKGKK